MIIPPRRRRFYVESESVSGRRWRGGGAFSIRQLVTVETERKRRHVVSNRGSSANSLPEKTPITLIGSSGEEMESPEGEGLRTKELPLEEMIDSWEASANRVKPSFDSADFGSAHSPPPP